MVDFSKKIRNTNKFRQPAITFLQTGSYCSYPKGTAEYMQFWTTEQDRCINGYTADDGDYISGYNYFYLNYCPITRIVYKKVKRGNIEKIRPTDEHTFPDFYDYDYYFFQGIEEAEMEGKHMCVLKSRRKGFSYKGASMCCRNYYLIPESKSYVYASNKQYLTDDGILTKAWSYMDFIDEYTAWGKKRSTDTTMRKRAGMKVKDEYDNVTEVGYKSEIIGVTLKDNPDVVRGKRGKLILFEEAGSFSELGAAWQIARPSVEQNGETFGLMLAFGTGGDEGCITEDNYVYTSTGEMISIKELANQKLLGFDLKNKSISEEPIIHINKPTVKECVKLTTNTGRTIECSVDHPIFSSSKKDYNDCLQFDWINAENITVGDYIATCRNINYFGSETILNPRAIGIFIGDGTYRDKSSVRLTSCDEEIKSYIRNLYPCSIINSYATKDGRTCEQLLVKKAKHDINKVGINGQTKDQKRLPDNIFNCDKHTICELLAGLYDTDGCISTTYNKKRKKYSTIINLTQLSLTLLQQVLLLLQKLGIHGYIYKIKSRSGQNSIVKHVKEDSYYYSLDIHDVDSIREFQKNIHLLIKYKQDKLDDAILKLADVHSLRKDRGYVYERVVEKLYVGKKTVYNIVAGNTHTYIVNGIITHNSHFETLKDMFYNPEGYNCLGFPNIWDDPATQKECGFFCPYYTNLDTRDQDGNRLYMDEDGNTLRRESLDYILSERRKVIENATNSAAIDRYVAERCVTPAEAMLEFNGNIFPKKELQEQLARIRTNTHLKNAKQVGDLVWEPNGQLKWVMKKTGDITHYPLRQGEDATGSVVIWEHPPQEIPYGMYIIGVDSYDFDESSTTSLGSCFVYKRFQGFEENSETIVAEYTGRPKTAQDFYETVRKLAVYFNATIMYENQNKGIFSYFTAKHCDYLLADSPTIINDIVSDSKVNRKKGCHMSKPIKLWAEGLIKDWLNEEREDGTKNLYKILSEPLLEELISYNDIGNFDRCLTKDTLITTESGYKKVQDITVGDKVLTHTGQLKPVVWTDKHIHDGFKARVRLVGDYKILECTDNHPIYIAYTDKKIHKYRKESLSNKEFIRADQLTKKYQFGLLPKRKLTKQLDLSNDVLYLLGWIMSDGYVAPHSNQIRITYQLNQLNCAQRCANIIEEYLRDEEYYYSKNGKIRIQRKPVRIFRYKGCWRLEISSKKLHDLSMWFGCLPNNKVINPDIYNRYKNLMPFVIGWLEGDGHQRLNVNYDGCTRNGIELSTVYEQLINQCRQIMIDHGIYCSIRKVPSRRNYQTQYSILISNEYINKVLDYYPSLKYVKIQVNKNTSKVLEDVDGFWVPIQLLGLERMNDTVFNFEVQDDHTYVSNGIVTHNCMSLAQVMIYREQLYNTKVNKVDEEDKMQVIFDGPIFSQYQMYDDTPGYVEDNVFTFL